MVSLGRRSLLRLSTLLMAMVALLPPAVGRRFDDDVVVVRGWVLTRSDVRKLGW